MRPKLLITLFSLLLMAPIENFAQSSGLILRGTRSSSGAGCKNKDSDKECIQRRMTFENRGKQSVIIFNPTLGFGTGIKEIIEYNLEKDNAANKSSEAELERRKAVLDPEQLAIFQSLIPYLDSDSPPENLTRILEPGETFDFEESFVVPKKKAFVFKNEREISLSLRAQYECRYSAFVTCYKIPSYVRFLYEFSLSPYIKDPDFLENLALRWKHYGKLLINEEGVFSITSEPLRPY